MTSIITIIWGAGLCHTQNPESKGTCCTSTCGRATEAAGHKGLRNGSECMTDCQDKPVNQMSSGRRGRAQQLPALLQNARPSTTGSTFRLRRHYPPPSPGLPGQQGQQALSHETPSSPASLSQAQQGSLATKHSSHQQQKASSSPSA